MIEDVSRDDLVAIRVGDTLIGNGVGPNYGPYNAMLDSWVDNVPGIRRALVNCDGLIGSALLRK